MASPHQSADLVDDNITEWPEEDQNGEIVGLTLNTKAINIIWGGEGSKGRYWRRTTVDDDEEGPTEVVELLGVCWLEITGKINLNMLSPKTTYKFFVSLKFTPAASGWDGTLAIFRIFLPGDATASASVELSKYLDRRDWVNIPEEGLEFYVPEDNSGMLSFAMYEIEGEEWKKGLIIREVKFVPQVKLKTISLTTYI